MVGAVMTPPVIGDGCDIGGVEAERLVPGMMWIGLCKMITGETLAGCDFHLGRESLMHTSNISLTNETDVATSTTASNEALVRIRN